MSDEGEGLSPRPKRKIKKVMVLSSASSSDSDDSGPSTAARRKRLRVLSEEGSDSSSGSWAMGAIRRRRALPGLRDSGDDSDTSGWATDREDEPPPSTNPSTSAVASKSLSDKRAKAASGFSSDSSEGNSDKCSICLMKFLNQEVGTPQNCEHIFCLDCITEWSRNMNTCPVDRITFDSIVVRACAGGRVLRTELVKVVERRPSLEMMIIEDPTVCEICHNADHEESMLLCDGCDLGFHMQCLTPPLTRIPQDQWLCRNCDNVWRSVVLETQDGLLQATRFRPWSGDAAGREPAAAPSTSRAAPSASRAAPSASRAAPSASRAAPSASRAAPSASRAAQRTTTPRTRKRKYKRRTRTVVVEYEVEAEGKFPITKTRRVKTRVKKRKVRKRQPRTAARRTHVLASVRAKLASVRAERAGGAGGAGAGAAGELSARRAGAGIPALSLFGARDELDYFADGAEDERGWEGACAVVAARPTSAVLSAYRQARRKMVTIPSPTRAGSAPDLLSDILESQSRLHSKRSVVSVTVDGSVDIALEPVRRHRPDRKSPAGGEDKPLVEKKEVDLSKGEGARQAPLYPGQGRGWGGGYRYPREQNSQHHNQNHANQGYARGGNDSVPLERRDDPGAPFERRGDPGAPFSDYEHRRHSHRAAGGEPWHDTNRMHRRPDRNRAPNGQRVEDRRFSGGGPAWRPPRPPAPGPSTRHSFGGFENPLDMRMGPDAGPPAGAFARAPPSFPEMQQEKPQPYRPLPRPPSFGPEAPPAPDDDERSDEGLVIDTDKYDPTEPTRDDDSGDERAAAPAPAPAPAPSPPPPPPLPADAPSVDAILAGISSSGLKVPADILDSAVRQALEEHRALLGPAGEGDCPNFSIYSATSVHIASDCGRAAPAAPPPRRDSLEDLVQEDGELTPPPDPAERSLQEYKAKVSKRCPITTSTRNPIKIKLMTPALIKRHVSLYDDEDVEPEPEPEPQPQPDLEPEPEAEPELPRSPRSPRPGAEVRDEPEPEAHEPADDGSAPSDTEAQADRARDSDSESADELGKDHPKRHSDESASSGSAPRQHKMTESISETEDERSYTPCLDEHKDAPEPAPPAPEPRPKPIDELGTELISEEEAQDMFSEGSPAPRAPPEDGEILDRRPKDDAKRKRRKDAKKEARAKGRKRADVAFKKLAKNKERNYRKDKDKRRSVSSAGSRERRRKDKRKDLERYDVRTLVSERRRRLKDAFGRDVSPAGSEPGPPRRASPSPARRTRLSPSPDRRARPSPSPARRARPSPSPARRTRPSPSPARRARPSPSPARRPRPSPSPARRARPSPSPARRARPSPSPSPRRAPSAASPRREPTPKRRRKRSASRPKATRRRRSVSKTRKRRRSGSAATGPKPAKAKKKKRARAGSKARSPPASAVRRRKRARLASPPPAAPPPAWSPPRAASPRTPPPAEPAPEERRRRRDTERAHRRLREAAGPSKEVFTSGDNILVSVSFAEQARGAGGAGAGGAAGAACGLARRARRRRHRAPDAGPKPVAIIDLERSPFRELTPSPKHVIVLSDDEAESSPAAGAPPAGEAPPALGPKTPPEPAEPAPAAPPEPACAAPEGHKAGASSAAEGRGPLTPPEPPDSPDAYDPYEPTRSASASPAPASAPASAPAPALAPAEPAAPVALSMTLEAAQKTNLSADQLLDRRPLSPIEKVMALLQSTRDESPEAPAPRASPRAPPSPPAAPAAPAAPPPPAPPAPPAPLLAAPRVLLPEPSRAPPKLFLAKPSPIKSDPIKPMPQARLPVGAAVAGVRRSADYSPYSPNSPYSPGSSDFGDLFEPPQPLYKRPHRRSQPKRNKNKTTVDVKLDDDNLKILDELPSSAVEMQVKTKFLKKLNRQERVVEEVKLVLKPHYNKKHVSKDQYKHILRRAVPKICHNKTGEINPKKIQSLVEAYVKKFRKKRKLGK